MCQYCKSSATGEKKSLKCQTFFNIIYILMNTEATAQTSQKEGERNRGKRDNEREGERDRALKGYTH